MFQRSVVWQGETKTIISCIMLLLAPETTTASGHIDLLPIMDEKADRCQKGQTCRTKSGMRTGQIMQRHVGIGNKAAETSFMAPWR